VWDAGFRVKGLGCRVQGQGSGIRGSGSRVWDSGSRGLGSTCEGERVARSPRRALGAHRVAEVGVAAPEGAHLFVVCGVRLIDSCITQLKAQGPSRTCNERKEEEEEEEVHTCVWFAA